MAKTNLTAERLRDLLQYYPETGLFTWRISIGPKRIGSIAGCVNKHPTQGYRVIRIDDVLYKASRLAWLCVHGYWAQHDVDHINGIRYDDRICNLREATRSLNNENQRRAKSNNQSGLLGAHFCKRASKWTAEIKTDKQRKHLGTFDTPELAHAAYITAKRELHIFNQI